MTTRADAEIPSATPLLRRLVLDGVDDSILDEPGLNESYEMGQRLYVGNLSFHVTNDVLRSVFSEIGEVTDVHVVMDRETGQSRGFGFVTMGTSQLASEAISQMNGAVVEGRPLRVNEAEERAQRGGGGGGGFGGGGFGGGGGGGRRGGGGGGGGGDRRNRW